jgi:hypothetical protein
MFVLKAYMNERPFSVLLFVMALVFVAGSWSLRFCEAMDYIDYANDLEGVHLVNATRKDLTKACRHTWLKENAIKMSGLSSLSD